MTARHSVVWVLAVGSMLGFACGGSDKKAVEEPVVDEEPVEAEPEEEYIVPQEKLDEIQSYLDRQRKRVARCWTEALEAKQVPADADGQITLNFNIQPGGTLSDIEVSQVSHKSAALESCVVGMAKEWTITTLEKPLAYSYSFGFQRL